MASSASMENIFSFIRQANDQANSIVSSLQAKQQERAAADKQASQRLREAQQAQNSRSALKEEIRQEKQAIDALKTHSAQLHQRQAHLKTLKEKAAALDQHCKALSTQAEQLQSHAQAIQSSIDEICGKCGRIADSLDTHAAALRREAGLAREQADSFGAMSANRFAGSAADAANTRFAYAKNLDEIGEHASQLAQHYRNLAAGLVSPFTKQHQEAVKERLARPSNPAVTSLYRKFESKISIASNDYQGTAHYRPLTRSISFNAGADLKHPAGPASTYFHESGHFIDDVGGQGIHWLSSDPQYRKALEADVEAYITNTMAKHQCTRETAYNIVSTDLQGNINAGPSDIFGGLTGCRCQGDWGHTPSYWNRDPRNVEQEAFANMFEASVGNPEKQAAMQKFFPTAYAVFDTIVRRAAA